MLAQFRSAYSGGKAQFRSAYAPESPPIVVVTDIDAGDCSPAKTVITNGESTTPTVYCDVRDHEQLITWRVFLFAVENAEGKTPIFQFNRATRREKLVPPTNWTPLWTQDFKTWTKAPARTLTGTVDSGVIQWQFTDPLPAGRVYIASHPMGRQADSVALAAELLALYPSVASPTASADASGVYATSPPETDDIGREVGGHPMHAIKLAWGGATTDGGPKRKLVMFANIHSQGETPSWVSFLGAIDWMLLDASAEAQAFRSNWDVYLYFSLTPNGLYSGTYRRNITRTAENQDPNRCWKLDASTIIIDEIKYTANAVVADTGGAADALLSWHGWNGSGKAFNCFTDIEDSDAGTRTAAAQAMLDAGTTIFGESPSIGVAAVNTTDVWWGKAKLGAKVSFDSEVPHNPNVNSVSFYRTIGENWAKSLRVVDAQGVFYTPTSIALAAASLVATTATGSLTTGIALQGSASSVSLAAGVLTIGIRLRGDALSQAIAVAGLTTAIQLAAAAQAGASATGELTVGNTIDLAGNAQASALAMGSITTIIRFDAAAIAKVLGAGTLTAPGAPSQLAADATALAIAEGGLTTGINLRGAAASVVQASGTLDIALTFDAAAFATAMATGVLSTQVRLEAAAVAGALAWANLTGGIPLLAAHAPRPAWFRGAQIVGHRRPAQRITARRMRQYG